MNRRRVLAVLTTFIATPGVLAQANRTPPRIAFLGVFSPSRAEQDGLPRFREGLSDEGLTEGRDFTIEYFSEPQIERLPAKVAEVLKRGPALLVATTTPVAQAAAKATRQLPIVFNTVSDPVGSGLVASLARPGRNVTGVSNMLPELSGKLLELVRELLPDSASVAALWNPDNPAKALELAELRVAAAKLGVGLVELPVRSLPDIERALAAEHKGSGRALVIMADALTDVHRKRIDELTQARRIAVVSSHRTHTDAGGVLSYSPDYSALARRVGAIAGKILKGAKPAEIPVELPTRFEIVVNLKSAQALGLKIPQSVLLRANRVIE